MNNCAVIGASGFLGRSIVSKLNSSGYKVWAVYRNSRAEQPPGCIPISILEMLSSPLSFDVIFFAAGSFASSHSELVELNCTLLTEIKSRFASARLVFVSSTSVYGKHESRIHENSAFNHPSIYGLSKLAGEFVASAANSYAIIRLTYLYGKGLDNRSFIPNMIGQAREQAKITLFGEGARAQDYLHVEDAASLCLKAMYTENGIFLGATGKSYSNLDVAKAVAGEIKDCTIEFTGTETGHSLYFDPGWTMRSCDWTPATDLRAVIKEMLA